MKSIKTTDLRDGMKFDKPVYMDGDNVFVPPGIPIRQKDIDRLVRWEIDEVRTDGSLVVDTPKAVEPTVDLSGFKDLPSGDKANLDAYLRAIDEYEHIANAVAQGEEVDRAKVDATVNLILEKVKDNRNEMVQLILMGGRIERKIAAGIINVTILSTIMGTILKFTSHRLIQLATGALLYDIGMVKVPKSILKKKDKLTPDELNQIRTHPIHSYRIISKELKYPEEIGIIALQHHEHWDGQGYPRKLRGEDINLAARIVAVADSYIAMINTRPHRNSMIGYSAMKNVLSDNGRQYHSWRGKSKFTTMLTKLGIRHIRSRPYHPQTCGKIESFWRNLYQECLTKVPLATFEEAEAKIGEYIEYYNFKRPHQGIGNLIPSDRYYGVAGQVKQIIAGNTAAVQEALPTAAGYTPPTYLVGNIGGRELRLVAKDAEVTLSSLPEETINGNTNKTCEPAGAAGADTAGDRPPADGGEPMPAGGSIAGAVLPVDGGGAGGGVESVGGEATGPENSIAIAGEGTAENTGTAEPAGEGTGETSQRAELPEAGGENGAADNPASGVGAVPQG